ncbi:MAG: hypothetical protein HQM04_18515 [Magnetococcales bacterium]|nr:hypothetical protein [Magnetococcales bacterium]
MVTNRVKAKTKEDRLCSMCEKPFRPRFPGFLLCYKCWRLKRDQAMEAMEEKVRTAEARAKAAEERARLLSRMREVVPDPRLPCVEEWSGMVMRLVKLCHPDHHENSRESNDVCRWLLQQRKRMSAG